MTTLRVIRLQDVVQKTGLTKTTIYNRMRKGKFPKSFLIGGSARTVGWLEEDIDQYIMNHIPWFVVDERRETPFPNPD